MMGIVALVAHRSNQKTEALVLFVHEGLRPPLVPVEPALSRSTNPHTSCRAQLRFFADHRQEKAFLNPGFWEAPNSQQTDVRGRLHVATFADQKALSLMVMVLRQHPSDA
jgi:hypothetical protein